MKRCRRSISAGAVAANAAAVLLLSACSSSPGLDTLTSVDPGGRMHAASQAAAAGDTSAIPVLVEMLASDDPAERMVAIGTLERLTGERRGFFAAASPKSRAEAVARWYAWLESGQPVRRGDDPPTLPKPSGPSAPPDR